MTRPRDMLVMLTTLALVPAAMTAEEACVVEGKQYRHGQQWEPNACTQCLCVNGHSTCYVNDCAFMECVDAEFEPDQCGSVCPNGPNCRVGSVIIPVGKVMETEPGVNCTCLQPAAGAFEHRQPYVKCTEYKCATKVK